MVNKPELATLRARGFTGRLPTIEGDPNHEQLGQATLVVAAAANAFDGERRTGNPTLALSELGQAQAFAITLANMIQAREPEPGPLPDTLETLLNRKFEALQTTITASQATITASQATIENRLTDIDNRLTGIDNKLTRIENDVAKAKEEFNAFKTNFGRWSRPVSQRYNRQCYLGTGYRPVPCLNGEFPDEATIRLLQSRSSVLNLNPKPLAKICTMYGIKFPKKVVDRDAEKMRLDLLNHLCGVLEEGPIDEEQVEEEEEEGDDHE
ncbi:hypothetical protein FS837_008891 [Tulasnella sp. UAMH 9824]|nr:hypothetical protein FS837_008891 [Tulasnella sp. UAMH 9824]